MNRQLQVTSEGTTSRSANNVFTLPGGKRLLLYPIHCSYVNGFVAQVLFFKTSKLDLIFGSMRLASQSKNGLVGGYCSGQKIYFFGRHE